MIKSNWFNHWFNHQQKNHDLNQSAKKSGSSSGFFGFMKFFIKTNLTIVCTPAPYLCSDQNCPEARTSTSFSQKACSAPRYMHRTECVWFLGMLTSNFDFLLRGKLSKFQPFQLSAQIFPTKVVFCWWVGGQPPPPIKSPLGTVFSE